MASPFKIPKKKQPAGSDSSPPHMQSPLSRLQSAAPEFKSYGNQCGRGGAAGMHAGNALGSSANRQRVVVKTLLGLNSTNRGAPGANHRASGGWGSQSAPAQIAEPSAGCLSNGWRPKRASDRLLAPSDTSEWPSPPQKKTGASLSVRALDSLAALRGEEHAGSRSSSTWRSVDAPEGKGNAGSSPEPLQQQQQKNSSLSASDDTSEDDFVSPSRTRNKPPAEHVSPRTPSPRTTPGGRRSLNRTSWLADDPRERERERWREFRERKTWSRLRKPKQAPPEPIVLSSEEEDEGEDDADGGRRTSQGRGRAEQIQEADCGGGLSSGEMPSEEQRAGSSTGGTDEYQLPAPSFLQLDFTSLHAGLTHAHANGKMAITESGITIPLKGDEDGEVTVVASQVRGYGVWDGGVAQGGALLAGWKGPAPSLIFLWVTEAQANLLQTELTAIQTSTAAAGPSCCFLLLVLEEQLQELQAALLASILDMEEYRRGSSSSSGGPTSPLEWTDGLLLLHSCPPPLDQHLLQLLGHSEKSSPVRTNQRTKKSSLDSSALQQLPTRLIQYPAAPSKGRITVTKEDLACLGGGEFLNDVIIDFYLKYLLLEGVGGSVAERSHVFSSFFYKQLSRRRAAGEDAAPSVPDRHMRHQRVKTWTRHVDIFTKDFLFVPVNQEAHWYLVVVCFPGLEEVRYEDFQRPTAVATLREPEAETSWCRAEELEHCCFVSGGSERAAGPPPLSPRPSQPPQCTRQGWQRDTVLKRPCILVMDSLKLSYHENVCRLLRDYLQVEWEVRRATPRLFSSDSMRSSSCRVPQQDNSSDCGLYLLQYAESFLQNPVVHFDLPLRLDTWFLRQRVRQKREEIRGLIMRMHQSQGAGD